MPWREAARPSSASYIADPNVRGYSCLVSEVMLQQTQVAIKEGRHPGHLWFQGGDCGGLLHKVDGQVANSDAPGCLHP